MKKLTTNIFIERSKIKHKNKYDYSKVEYINSQTMVIIICPIHGEFEQKANDHLRGCGCFKCIKTYKLNTEKFILKAKSIHGDKYDYSKVEYINSQRNVIIICPIHGEFEQTPARHLFGQGCSSCYGNKKLTTEQFIEKSNIIHNNKYDYSEVIYKNYRTKIIIICPVHGKFKQFAGDHLWGSGCTKCNNSKLEEKVKSFLINKNIKFINHYYGFSWLKNKNKLELDFYLPDYNIGIECQGRQHFEPVEQFGGQSAFDYLKENDEIKKRLCSKHNLPLYYINHNDNIESKLMEFL